MKLTTKDRLVLGSILLKKGSLLKMKLCSDITKKVEFSADEIKECGMEFENNQYTFKENTEREFDFTEDEMSLIKECAQICNQNEEVTADNIELIKKLIDG